MIGGIVVWIGIHRTTTDTSLTTTPDLGTGPAPTDSGSSGSSGGGGVAGGFVTPDQLAEFQQEQTDQFNSLAAALGANEQQFQTDMSNAVSALGSEYMPASISGTQQLTYATAKGSSISAEDAPGGIPVVGITATNQSGSPATGPNWVSPSGVGNSSGNAQSDAAARRAAWERAGSTDYNQKVAEGVSGFQATS